MVVVGSTHPQAFMIHKHLLALHSKYFSNLFRKVHERAKKEASETDETSDESEGLSAINFFENKDGISNAGTDGNTNDDSEEFVSFEDDEDKGLKDQHPDQDYNGDVFEGNMMEYEDQGDASSDSQVDDPDNESEDNQNESLDDDEEMGRKIRLPQFNAYIFADFYCFLYSGKLLEAKSLEHETSGEQLTALGKFLEAPAFQNLCMAGNITQYRDDKQYDHWMTVRSVRSVYDCTEEGSLLRKLVADLLNCLNPIGKARGSKLNEWKALLADYPDVEDDMESAPRRAWGKDRSWDEQFWEDYMVKETPLDEAWYQQILEMEKRRGAKYGMKSHEREEVWTKIQGEHKDKFVGAKTQQRGEVFFYGHEKGRLIGQTLLLACGNVLH